MHKVRKFPDLPMMEQVHTTEVVPDQILVRASWEVLRHGFQVLLKKQQNWRPVLIMQQEDFWTNIHRPGRCGRWENILVRDLPLE